MKKIFFIGLLLLSLSPVFSQDQSDSIAIRKGFSTTFRQHGKALRLRRLLDITRTNAEAYQEMKIARNNYNIGYIFGGVGGFMFGYGTAFLGGTPNYPVAGVGAVVIVVSLPFDIAFMKHAKKAVKIYNAGLKLGNSRAKIDSTPTVSTNQKHSVDILSSLYYSSSDSSYQNYINKLQSLLKHDVKVISFEYREYKYWNGQIKSRGLKAKHKYGFNEDYSYKIGTWEFYTKEGVFEKSVNYDLTEKIVTK